MSNYKEGDGFWRTLGTFAAEFTGVNAIARMFGGEGFAMGTSYAPGGVAMVGERGPELVSLPRGSRVATAPRTAGLMTNQEGLMRELINKVDNLGNGGAQTINLVVDGKVLASTVFKNSSYTSIG